MSDTNHKTDKEKGDEVLRRMQRTPPKPKNKTDEKVGDGKEKYRGVSVVDLSGIDSASGSRLARFSFEFDGGYPSYC